MEQSPSWEANGFSASQDIPWILWYPKVYKRIHKIKPQVSPLYDPWSLIYSNTYSTYSKGTKKYN
jgi:hypothetical protein